MSISTRIPSNSPNNILPPLRGCRLHIGILAARQDGYKYLCRVNLAGVTIGPTQRFSGKIYKQLFPGFVAKNTAGFCAVLPVIKMMRKLRIAVSIGMAIPIAPPKDRQDPSGTQPSQR